MSAMDRFLSKTVETGLVAKPARGKRDRALASTVLAAPEARAPARRALAASLPAQSRSIATPARPASPPLCTRQALCVVSKWCGGVRDVVWGRLERLSLCPPPCLPLCLTLCLPCRAGSGRSLAASMGLSAVRSCGGCRVVLAFICTICVPRRDTDETQTR